MLWSVFTFASGQTVFIRFVYIDLSLLSSVELVHVPNTAKNIHALNESVLSEMFIFSVKMGQSFQENVTPFVRPSDVAGKEADQEQETQP